MKDCKNEEVRNIIKDTHALITDEEGMLLFSLPSRIPIQGAIVEIGSYKGGSAVLLAKGSRRAGRKGNVYAIDPHYWERAFWLDKEFVPTDTFRIFSENIKKAGVNDLVIPVLKTSHETVRNWKQPISLLWIDGNHDYIYVKMDFLLWEKYLINGGVIAFHDSRASTNIVSARGVPLAIKPNAGPLRVVKKYILRSPRFNKVNVIDSITIAEKVKNASLLEVLKNKLWICYAITVMAIIRIRKSFGRFLEFYYPCSYSLLERIKNRLK